MDIEIPPTPTESLMRLPKGPSMIFRLSLLIAGLFIFIGLWGVIYLSTPPHFVEKPPFIVSVKSGMPLGQVAHELKSKSIVRSEYLFRFAVQAAGVGSGVRTGDYVFEVPASVWTVAWRLVHGEQGLERVRVTLPEGQTVREMAATLVKKMPAFDTKKFIEIAEKDEGFLFPDTYFFFPNVTPEDVRATLRAAFDKKFTDLRKSVIAITVTTDLVEKPIATATTSEFSRRNEHDIVTMASIVEKEATNDTDRAVIAGILWKRLDRGMLLQVDPPFAYLVALNVLPKNDLNPRGFVSLEDLKVKSPYNTYLNKGLPLGPISNPGLSALRATVMPTTSPYYFYLSDKDGTMHYAKNYEGHLENRALYMD